MVHEKIIKDERGEITIIVKLWSDYYHSVDRDGNTFRYDVTVHHKAPRKRTLVVNSAIATQEEIQAAKMEYWNLIKP